MDNALPSTTSADLSFKRTKKDQVGGRPTEGANELTQNDEDKKEHLAKAVILGIKNEISISLVENETNSAAQESAVQSSFNQNNSGTVSIMQSEDQNVEKSNVSANESQQPSVENNKSIETPSPNNEIWTNNNVLKPQSSNFCTNTFILRCRSAS